jgi:hypothetical protein
LLDAIQRLQAELSEVQSAGAESVRAVPARVPAGKRRENAA